VQVKKYTSPNIHHNHQILLCFSYFSPVHPLGLIVKDNTIPQMGHEMKLWNKCNKISYIIIDANNHIIYLHTMKIGCENYTAGMGNFAPLLKEGWKASIFHPTFDDPTSILPYGILPFKFSNKNSRTDLYNMFRTESAPNLHVYFQKFSRNDTFDPISWEASRDPSLWVGTHPLLTELPQLLNENKQTLKQSQIIAIIITVSIVTFDVQNVYRSPA